MGCRQVDEAAYPGGKAVVGELCGDIRFHASFFGLKRLYLISNMRAFLGESDYGIFVLPQPVQKGIFGAVGGCVSGIYYVGRRIGMDDAGDVWEKIFCILLSGRAAGPPWRSILQYSA